MIPLIERIQNPEDLKSLSIEELDLLAYEIRKKLVDTTAKTGGHLAPSLGAVELILGIHLSIDCPTDKLFFDVGHQAYAHKIITGRLDEFDTLRTYGGLSGFTKKNESPYDSHDSGHASDSLSSALGYAYARDLRGGTEKVVALIGDGSISGGLAFEALNHMGQKKTPLIIVLNDNTMSISKNVGAISLQLARARTNPVYQNATKRITRNLSRNEVSQWFLRGGLKARASLKQLVVSGMLFEEMGIKYIGPINGHDITAIADAMDAAKNAKEPVIIHAITRKGKGYLPAEERPDVFHGIGPFDRATGEQVKDASALPSYTKVFSDALIEEARFDEDIVAITAAMAAGTGLDAFEKVFPDRFFDVGIAEEHAVTLATGLALGGKTPVVAIYSTFLQRAFDQIVINAALQNLHIVFCIDRAGIVGADGPTHNGAFDMAYLRMIPNMTILAPSNERELRDALHTAISLPGPVAVRYPRGSVEGVDIASAPALLPVGESVCVHEGADVAILAIGQMVNMAQDVAGLLGEKGIHAHVRDMRYVKPLDIQAVTAAAAYPLVVTLEEGCVAGGFGSAVLETLAAIGLHPDVLNIGLPDEFIAQGNRGELLESLQLDAPSITDRIFSKLKVKG